MEKEKKPKKILKLITNIITWTVLSILVAIIMFLVFVVVTTKVSEKNGGRPLFALYTIVSPSMVPNINVYDVVFVSQTDTTKLKVGDVISFYVSGTSMFNSTPVTHRIKKMTFTTDNTYAFKTKGDNNDTQDEWTIYENDIIGKVLFKIPQLGRLQFFLVTKTGWFIIILIPALGIIAYDLFKIMKLLILKNKIKNEQQKGNNEEPKDGNIVPPVENVNNNINQVNGVTNMQNQNINE